jgi:hypothetical protein
MIYILVSALLLTALGIFLRGRKGNIHGVLLDMLVASGLGLLAGVFIGVGARFGMWAIVIANGNEWRFSISGSLTVIGVFSTLGIALGLIYEGLLRNILRRSGLIFGLLLTLGLWYPLGEAARQDLTFQPSLASLMLWTGICVAIIFMPYAVSLELLLGRWHRRRELSSPS